MSISSTISGGGGGSGSGALSQGAGTTITDEHVVRGDTPTGLQGSSVTINDAGLMAVAGKILVLGDATVNSDVRLKAPGSSLDLKSGDDLYFMAVRCGLLISLTFDGNPRIQLGADAGILMMGSAVQLGFSSITAANGTIDTGLARAAAGKLIGTDGSSGIGSLNGLRPPTSSASPVSLTQLPNVGESCIHKNTATGFVHLGYNDGGTVRSVQLV